MTGVNDLPGLHERELAGLGNCLVCGEKLLAPPPGRQGADLTFYRVQITRLGWDGQALQRQLGLAMMLGGHGALAAAMGPDECLARIFDGPSDGAVHESCASKIHHVLELMPEPDEDEQKGIDHG